MESPPAWILVSQGPCRRGRIDGSPAPPPPSRHRELAHRRYIASSSSLVSTPEPMLAPLLFHLYLSRSRRPPRTALRPILLHCFPFTISWPGEQIAGLHRPRLQASPSM
jgi:hypothetical protein